MGSRLTASPRAVAEYIIVHLLMDEHVPRKESEVGLYQVTCGAFFKELACRI